MLRGRHGPAADDRTRYRLGNPFLRLRNPRPCRSIGSANINTVCVGSHARPKLRGPGTVGIAALTALSKRFYVVMPKHHRGAFVERVDFLNGPSHRRRLVAHRPGTTCRPAAGNFVSNLGVFDFETTTKGMRIVSLHPGVTIDQVRTNTGFEMLVEGTPPVTKNADSGRTTIAPEGRFPRRVMIRRLKRRAQSDGAQAKEQKMSKIKSISEAIDVIKQA